MEHPVLARSASGLRHLRWAREVLGTLRGFLVFEAHLSGAQQGALAAEIEHVTALVTALSAAVKPYRDFLERTRTLARGRLRASEYMLYGGEDLASAPGPMEADTAHAEAKAELASLIEPERRRLHVELERVIDATREGLRAMDERLARSFSAAFVAALYPALTADTTRVLDDGDPNDDAAG